MQERELGGKRGINMPVQKRKSNEITIAIIGLIGVLATAIISNWRIIFPDPNEFTAKSINYIPTNDFDSEYRHFFDVSGSRKSIEIMIQGMINNLKDQLIKENPNDLKKIDEIVNATNEISGEFIDVTIRKLLPIYKNHFTIEELKAINRFYSTAIMQNFIEKSASFVQESTSIMGELQNDFASRLEARLNKGKTE